MCITQTSDQILAWLPSQLHILHSIKQNRNKHWCKALVIVYSTYMYIKFTFQTSIRKLCLIKLVYFNILKVYGHL